MAGRKQIIDEPKYTFILKEIIKGKKTPAELINQWNITYEEISPSLMSSKLENLTNLRISNIKIYHFLTKKNIGQRTEYSINYSEIIKYIYREILKSRSQLQIDDRIYDNKKISDLLKNQIINVHPKTTISEMLSGFLLGLGLFQIENNRKPEEDTFFNSFMLSAWIYAKNILLKDNMSGFTAYKLLD